MTKNEIFSNIEVCVSEASCVPISELRDMKVKDADTTKSRRLFVFWCDAAGFESGETARYLNTNEHTIRYIRRTIESKWKLDATFRILVLDIGKRLEGLANTIEHFEMDLDKVYHHWQIVTGRKKVK